MQAGTPTREPLPRGRAASPPSTGSHLKRRGLLWRVSPAAEPWIGLALCAGLVLAWAWERLVPNPAAYAQNFAPDWLPIAAAGFAAAGILPLEGTPRWVRIQRILRWTGLALLVWTANGLPLDVFRVVGLIPLGVDWPGMATRALALAAAVVLARPLLTDPATPPATRPASWYGYVAFGLALPYPLLRTHWALGGTLGLLWAGAAGEGWIPWLASIPFWVAAGLSLFLVSPPRWMPRRLLLAGGWSATAIVGMIGPAAFWALVAAVLSGADLALGGIEFWVYALFYGSWVLWAIAEAVATRSYQVRSATGRSSVPV